VKFQNKFLKCHGFKLKKREGNVKKEGHNNRVIEIVTGKKKKRFALQSRKLNEYPHGYR